MSHTPGPWRVDDMNQLHGDPNSRGEYYMTIAAGKGYAPEGFNLSGFGSAEDESLIIAAPDLLEALHEGRRAIGEHFAPGDCYATGPVTGDPARDLIQCPACSFIVMYDAAIAKARGES